RAEHVHGMASQLRLLLVHAHATDLDRTLITKAGEAIDARGREALLTDGFQPTVAAMVAPLGFDLSTHAPIPTLTRGQKSEALNALLLRGATPTLVGLSALLTSAEDRADRLLADAPFGPKPVPVQGCGWASIEEAMNMAATVASWIDPEFGA